MRTLLMAALFAATAGTVFAQQVAGDLVIVQPWARATAPDARTGVIYVSIANKGASEDRLVGVTSEVAESAEIHQTMDMNGMAMMEAMGKGVAIPAGQTVTLKPGGMHVMLMGLKRQLKLGESVPLTLNFQKAGKVAVTAEVAGPGASGPSPH